MPTLTSSISPASDTFRANAEQMRGAGRRHAGKAATSRGRDGGGARAARRAASCCRASGWRSCSMPARRFSRSASSPPWDCMAATSPRRGHDRRRRPRRGPRGDGRRQRRHGEGRHLLSDDGEEASARAGDRAAEQSALHLSGRFRRRQSAEPGRGVSRPRAFRPHLLQPGEHVGGRHPADRLRHGIVHGGRRLCAGDVGRDDHGAEPGDDLSRRPAAGEGGDRRGGDGRGSRRRRSSTRGCPASPTILPRTTTMRWPSRGASCET